MNISSLSIIQIFLIALLPATLLNGSGYTENTESMYMINVMDVEENGITWIVRLPKAVNTTTFKNVNKSFIDSNAGLEIRSIYSRENIYEMWFGSNYKKSAQIEQLELLESKGIISSYKQNSLVETRSTNPNDPVFPEQWDMSRINMPLAWDISTGGVTKDGDTIVVAILDTGYDLTHADLMPNFYYNRDEIPNDGVDNDENGYADDYLGLNLKLGNDAHSASTHGASVCGIIGAKGNNTKNVTGINWDIKMMMVSGIVSEADIIEGYQYILDTRIAYTESNGEKGAFIVATNLSAGIDNAFSDEHPIWCNIYDDLGKAGILNCGATTNKNSNVEIVGDMPTTCTSEYLIAVTNTNDSDEKVSNAGYGAASIDIAAPGNTTTTTKLGGGTGGFPGTSAATPHVTGLIALMYSAACDEFLTKLKTDPEMGLIDLRGLILNNVDLFNGLKDITVSGGRLNAFQAMKSMTIICGDGIEAETMAITEIAPNPSNGRIDITFQTPDNEDYVIHIVDVLGRIVRTQDISSPLLSANTISYDTRKLATGVYYAVLQKGKEVSTQKFLVE